jgi:hypothetical protein
MHGGASRSAAEQRPDVALTANRTAVESAARKALIALGGFFAFVVFVVVGLRLRVLRRRRPGRR